MALDINTNFKINAGVNGQAAIDNFVGKIKKADEAAASLHGRFNNVNAALGGLAIGAAVATLTQMASAAIDNADALNDMAERTGIAGSALSELQYAATMNGTSLETVEKALTKVSTKALDAATGNKQAAATFDALGISVLGLDGNLKSSDVLLQDVADVLNTVEDRTTRTALAIEVFGKSGAQLIPLLENMKDAREEARRLGIVVSDDFQKSAAEFNDNMDRMGFLAKSFATDLANEVIPTLNRFMSELSAGREIFGGYWEATKNIGLTNPFNTPTENAKKYKEQAAGLTKQIEDLASGQNKWFGKDTVEGKARIAELNAELENTQKLVKYFERMSGQTSTAGAGRGSVNPPNAVSAQSMLDKLRAANEKEDKGGKSPKESEFERLKRQLEDQKIRVEDLTEAEKFLREVQLGRYKDLTPEQQKTIEALAREVDYKKSMSDAEKAMSDQQSKVSRQRETDAKRQSDELEKQRERWMDIIDPAAKYREELEKIRDAFREGTLTAEQATSLEVYYAKQIEQLKDVKDKGKDAFEELKDAVDGWGKQATDAFVDFAFTGKTSFSDMTVSILKDLARMLVQKKLMGPLFDMVGSSMGSAAGDGIGAAIAGFFGFANGGVMTGSGPMSLRTYASGGVATGPQLALYGEGSMNEAFVPLPDGKTIPVTMQGGGGSTTVVVNVSAEGTTSTEGGDGKAKQLGNLIANAVRQEIVNQKRPGGLLAA